MTLAMAKGSRNISIDHEVWEKAQRKFKGEVSSMIEDFLRIKVLEKNSISNIDEEELKKSVKEIYLKKQTLDSEYELLQNELRKKEEERIRSETLLREQQLAREEEEAKQKADHEYYLANKERIDKERAEEIERRKIAYAERVKANEEKVKQMFEFE